jgi:hypothetical protein
MLIRFLHIALEQVCCYTRIEHKIDGKITSANRSSKVPEGTSLVPSEYIVLVPREKKTKEKICVRDHRLT